MTVYRWRGKGHVPGIPARDLTEEEAEKYGVMDSPLYVKVGAPRAKKEAEEPDTTPEEQPAEAVKEGE